MKEENHISLENSGALDSSKILYDFLENSQKELKGLKEIIRELEKEVSTNEKLYRYFTNGWKVHLLQLIDENSSYFKRIQDENPNLSKLICSLYVDSKKETDDILKRFPMYFEHACSKSGIDIDHTSRHPSYKVCHAFINLEIMEKSGKARIFDREGTLEKLPCDIDAIIELIQIHNERLFNRDFDSKQFLNQLHKYYHSIIKKENYSDGESLPIRRITTRMGKNIKGFRTDEFLIDLSKLIRSGELEIKGQKLDFQQTKNTKQGMLLQGLEDRGYIGFISFKRVV